MLIVPIGKVRLQVGEEKERGEFMRELNGEMKEM